MNEKNLEEDGGQEVRTGEGRGRSKCTKGEKNSGEARKGIG